MVQNPDFSLFEINSTYHLLPTGQALASNLRGIHISKSGSIIWNLFANDISASECADKFIIETQVPEEYISEARADVINVVKTLKKNGVLVDSTPSINITAKPEFDISLFSTDDVPLYSTISIADINIALYGFEGMFDEKLLTFKSSPSNIHQSVFVYFNTDIEQYLHSIKSTEPYIHSESVDIYKIENALLFIYPQSSQLHCMWIDNSLGKAHIICKRKMRAQVQIKEDILQALRIPFLLLAKTKGLYAVHSASVLYKNKAILFSALSGTGKSTQAKHWTDGNYATNINGDVNLIGIKNGIPMVYGIPWCGTSEIYSTGTFELGTIAYIKRVNDNVVNAIPGYTGLVSLSKRLITLMLTPYDLRQFFNDMNMLSQSVTFCKLFCTKEVKSQKVLKHFIDERP